MIILSHTGNHVEEENDCIEFSFAYFDKASSSWTEITLLAFLGGVLVYT